MATAFYSPEQAVGASSMQRTADFLASLENAKPVSLAHGSVPAIDALPPPNPHFVFPASPSSMTPSFAPAPRRRRPLSAIETHTRSFSLAVETTDRIPRHAALPDFSFNPGASLPPDPHSLLSPPITPNSPRTILSAARPLGHGHRRGGSEFVGGRIREGSSIAVMSTSPTKLESDFASPMLQPPPPRRGHRRGMSGAISTNDLPIIPPPPLEDLLPKGNSAPNSPTGFERNNGLLPLNSDETQAIISLPEPVQPLEPEKNTSETDTVPAVPVVEPNAKQTRPVPRARVGFSDTLEFIPRPLSLVSNDTSSTTTARPGHYVSDSISSVVSATSHGGRDSPAPLSRTPTSEVMDSRPSTAGAILERATEPQAINRQSTSPRRRNSLSTLLDVAEVPPSNPATSSPAKSSKRWSFFGLDPFTGSGSPTKGRPASSSSSDSTPRAMDAGSCSDHASVSSADASEGTAGKNKKNGKKDSKKKRVKGWAGSILPLKPKGHKKRAKPGIVRPPTPPASVSHHDDEDEDEPEPSETETGEFEVTTPVVTISESPTPTKQTESSRRSADDTAYPMIDLDAALGPFNTPLSYNPEWEAAQRAAGNSGKRRLHSAQGLKGFSGPGMHYHRRAESAPDLPPFDPGRSAIHRFGSSSTMADVFEEDEEDDEQKDGRRQAKAEETEESDGEITPPAVTLPPSNSLLDTQEMPLQKVRRRSSGLSDRDPSSIHSIRAESSKASLQEEVIAEEPTATFRAPKLFQGPRVSVDSGAPSPRQPPGNNDLPVVEDCSLNLPNGAAIPLSPYSTTHSSSHPSPRSPMSMDAQRISTAPSSVTDDSFQSLLMGEPGPEVRISIDYDIPSLTSSTSTMTRESSFVPIPRPRPSAYRDQRPVSVSSAAFGRRRSSLVSLSRLISSAHGERSKLSTEVTLDNEPESRRPKSSKTKRLGRMMQFWKSNKHGAAT